MRIDTLSDGSWTAVSPPVERLLARLDDREAPGGLFGYQGTGKRSAARWLAQQTRRPFRETSRVDTPDALLASTAAVLGRSAVDWSHLDRQLLATPPAPDLFLYVAVPGAARRDPARWAAPLRAAAALFQNLVGQGGVVVVGAETEPEAVALVAAVQFVVPTLSWTKDQTKVVLAERASVLLPMLDGFHAALGGHPLLWRRLIDHVAAGRPAPSPAQLADGAWLGSADSPFQGWLVAFDTALRDRPSVRETLDAFVGVRGLQADAEYARKARVDAIELEALGAILTWDEVPNPSSLSRQVPVRPLVAAWRRR